MLPEKPDNSLPWRQRLEELETLPEEYNTDKKELWEKLSGRLQKRRSTSTNWYWLVAACLLVVCILPLIHPAKKQPSPVRPEIIQHTEKNVNSNQSAVATTPSLELHSGQIHTPGAQPPRKIKYLPETRVKREPAAHFRLDLSARNKVTVGVIAPEITDSLLRTSFEPAKKKLRVVHINEIELPAKYNFPTGSKNATAVFQIPRAKQLYSGGFESDDNTSQDLLKIKLSPSN